MDRGVRLALESHRPIAEVARDLGIHPEALRKRVRQAQADSGRGSASLLTTGEREEIRGLRKDNFELRRANEILKSASLFFARELAQTERNARRRLAHARSSNADTSYHAETQTSRLNERPALRG